MRSEEARIGSRVKVIDGRKREYLGKVGRIGQRYGRPDYLALFVRFDDGRSSLFWRHELIGVPREARPRRRLSRLWHRREPRTALNW